MSKTEERIIEILKKSKSNSIFIDDLVDELLLSRKTVLKNINDLVDAEEIIKIGKGKDASVKLYSKNTSSTNKKESKPEKESENKAKVYEFLKLNDGKYTYDKLEEELGIDKKELINIISELVKEGSVNKVKSKDKKIVISFNHDEKCDECVDIDDSDELEPDDSDENSDDIEKEYIVNVNGQIQGKMTGTAKSIYNNLIRALSVTSNNSSYSIKDNNILNITIRVGTKG